MKAAGSLAEFALGAAEVTAQALAESWLGEEGKREAFFLLETQGLSPDKKRFSLLAGKPLFSFLGRGRRSVLSIAGHTWELEKPPEEVFELLGRGMKAAFPGEEREGLFPLLGWLSYEAGARYERLPLAAPDALGLPDWYFMLPEEWAWLDEEAQQWRFRQFSPSREFFSIALGALGLFGSLEHAGQGADAWMAKLKKRLEKARALDPAPQATPPRKLAVAESLGKEGFCQAVLKAKARIKEGEVYQVNLSHRQQADYRGRAWPLFRRLSQINPSPCAAFADLGPYQVVCGSPEKLFSQRGAKVETHPIAGTMARAQSVTQLKLSEKDQAEHVMTVDIERNDLGRVCQAGSVLVDGLMSVESYSHVHHLVSKVKGDLLPGLDLPDLFRAGFPGGSITGAPKIRCMEIIAELEKERRGLYTGALGYWDPVHQRADFNIVIRTLFLYQGRAHWQVGSGIVADSVPEKEWEETLAKAAALKQALETAPL